MLDRIKQFIKERSRANKLFDVATLYLISGLIADLFGRTEIVYLCAASGILFIAAGGVTRAIEDNTKAIKEASNPKIDEVV